MIPVPRLVVVYLGKQKRKFTEVLCKMCMQSARGDTETSCLNQIKLKLEETFCKRVILS